MSLNKGEVPTGAIIVSCLLAVLIMGNAFQFVERKRDSETIASLKDDLKRQDRDVMHKQIGNDHFISLDEGNEWYSADLSTYGGWKFSNIKRAPSDIQTHFEMLQARKDYIEKGGDNKKVLELLSGGIKP